MSCNKLYIYFLTLCCSLFYLEVAYSKAPQENTALKNHPSPYLRSHAEDPVNWQIISTQSLQRAKSDKRLILISSGYQSCYWCYRMKKDTFSDQKLAKLINTSFVPILIDREMEEIIDQQLQQFMQEQRGFGGWPLTVVLTPQGDPVVGFSYISAVNLSNDLNKLLEQWKSGPEQIITLSKAAREARVNKHKQQDQLLKTPNYQELLQQFLQQISAASDDTYGGFGDQEKFPNIPQLSALLDIYSLNPDPNLNDFLQLTLDNMLERAIHDPIGGGFFRYSGNRDWSNPHYEQMLYTQALMGKLLIRAGQALKKPDYLLAGKDTLLNMIHRFRDESQSKKKGLYHTALSAISTTDKQQAGSYYLWTPTELENILGKHWQRVVENLNQDDQLILAKPVGKQRKAVKALLLKEQIERHKNQSQSYDDKKLLAWHGLVLSGLSYGAQLSPELAKAAQSLADKLLVLVEQQRFNTLMAVTEMEVTEAHAGTVSLSNLVYVAQGLVDWWQVSGSENALKSAKKLLEIAHKRFYQDERWLQENPYGILVSPPSRAIPDNQLPSPSAMWLSLAWGLSDLDKASNKHTDLTVKADHIGSQLPLSLQDEAFFHATLISTVIARQWRLRNNRQSKQLSNTPKK